MNNDATEKKVVRQPDAFTAHWALIQYYAGCVATVVQCSDTDGFAIECFNRAERMAEEYERRMDIAMKEHIVRG